MNRNSYGFPSAQRGAALIVGLVLLLVLTVLGISGMSTAILEATMANNSQQTQYAFQAAESALDAQVVTAGPFAIDNTTLQDQPMGATITYPYFGPDDKPIASADATTRFRTIAASAPGGGWEIGTMSAVHFQVDVTATSQARGARAGQRAGYFIMAPSP